MSSRTSQLLAAAAIDSLYSFPNKRFVGQRGVLFAEIARLWPTIWTPPDEIEVIEILDRLGGVTWTTHPATQDFLKVEVGLIETSLNNPHLLPFNFDETYPTVSEYWQFGVNWLKRVWEFEKAQLDENATEVPASDRLVTLDHNSADLVEIQAGLRLLAIQIDTSNDVGNLTEDQRQVAILEVRELGQLLEAPVVRLDGIRERTVSTLSWIGQQAAGAVVGASAMALLAAIASYFGFGF